MLEISHLRYDVTAEDGAELGILQDISLTIDDGKLVVITGPNGGGKTTLARSIMGLNQPTGGSIRWNGEDITNRSITDRARAGVSYGFQQPPRFKGMKVRDSTLLIISHQERIIQLADEILVIEKGKVAKHGPREEIFPQIMARTLPGCGYMKEGER